MQGGRGMLIACRTFPEVKSVMTGTGQSGEWSHRHAGAQCPSWPCQNFLTSRLQLELKLREV